MIALVFNPVMPDWSVAQTLLAQAALITIGMVVLYVADHWPR